MRVTRLLAATVLVATPALAQNGGQDNAVPNQAKPAQGTSPVQQPGPFQPLGSFPTDEITSRPYVGPQGGANGLKEAGASLRRVLTGLQQDG